jgi:hypothetical protein
MERSFLRNKEKAFLCNVSHSNEYGNSLVPGLLRYDNKQAKETELVEIGFSFAVLPYLPKVWGSSQPQFATSPEELRV